MSDAARRSPFALLGGLLAAYLAVPLVAFAIRLATSGTRGFQTPGLFPALVVSVICATISLALITVLGLPLAYLLARRRGRLLSLVGVLVQLPLALPPVMSGILLIYLVGPYTFLGVHLGDLTDSMIGIVLAQSFVAAPFLLVAARAAFGAVDPALLDVAATLGHGEVGRFLRVALPAAAPGLRAGMLLAWLRAFGEYGATVIVAYHPFSLPVYTFNQFSAAGLPTTQAPTALALGAALGALGVSQLPLGRLLVPRRATPRPESRPRAHTDPAAPGAACLPGGAAGTVPSSPPRGAVPAPPLRFAVAHTQGSFQLAARHAGAGRLAVLGPSGSGKSTLLACLAGLRGPAAGSVVVGGEELGAHPPAARNVGYVAQGFSLFPHLRIGEQLCFGVGADPLEAGRWAERLRLDGLLDRRPGEVSGGERQRAALAQALARAPRVLLLDEPFAALDVPVRREMQRELRGLQRSLGTASVLVTHDPAEAALLADELVVLAGGRVLQAGTVRALFSCPASAEVAHLLGIANFGEGWVRAPGEVLLGGAAVRAATGELSAGTRVHWSVVPEAISVERPSADLVAARVCDLADLGATLEVVVAIENGPELRARLIDDPGVAVGAPCGVRFGDGLRVWSTPEGVPGASGSLAGQRAAP